MYLAVLVIMRGERGQIRRMGFHNLPFLIQDFKIILLFVL